MQRPLTGELAPLEPRLRVVAEKLPEESHEELDGWFAQANKQVGPLWRELAVLTGTPGFIRYAETLAENYILFAVGPPEPSKRRLMKFGYEEPFRLGEDPDAREDEELPAWDRWRERFGWRVKTVNLDMPAVNLAASFHVEVPAPRDMEVQLATLVFKRHESPVNRMRGPDDASQSPTDSVEELPATEKDGPLVQRAHLYKVGVGQSATAEARIFLRARRPGFLRAASLTGALTFVLLLGGYAYLDDIAASDNSQTAAALLLLGPTLLAGSLIRPGEHRMVASVLLGVRALLAADVAATVLAVGVLAGAAACARSELWLAATVISGVAAAGLAVSYLLPRPTQS